MSEAREPQNGMQLLAEDEEAPQIVPAAELQFCTDPSAPDQVVVEGVAKLVAVGVLNTSKPCGHHAALSVKLSSSAAV